MGADHSTSTSGVIDREGRLVAGSEIARKIEVEAGAPAAVSDCVVDRGVKNAASRNVICGDVHRRVGADRSPGDQEAPVAADSEIAREIEVEAGAPADAASSVVDRGIKSADR